VKGDIDAQLPPGSEPPPAASSTASTASTGRARTVG
jgi:hypothetical protein